ncbi:SGNH hydrolase-type esterase domain-containing protein, partial [Dactylonectria estremocensis]
TAYPQLVLFGDSLLQGSVDIQSGFSFQATLQTRLIRRLDVLNRGFAGWNTKNALEYLPKIFPEPNDLSPKLDYLIILLGANDAIVPHPESTRDVPVHQYKDNLTRIISHAHIKSHNPKILLVTPPPVDETKLNSLGHEPRTVAHTALYAEAVRQVVEENPEVVLIDLWKAVMDKAAPSHVNAHSLPGSPEGDFNRLFTDGLHMNGEAYRLFYDLATPHIPEGESSQYIYPDWRDLAS